MVEYIVVTRSIQQRHEPDPVLRIQCKLSFEGFARFMTDKDNFAFAYETINQSDQVQYFILHC